MALRHPFARVPDGVVRLPARLADDDAVISNLADVPGVAERPDTPLIQHVRQPPVIAARFACGRPIYT